jgi:hypothetical protein
MKQRTLNNSRLYVSKDIYQPNVYYARTDVEKFARFHKVGIFWNIWIYPYSQTEYKLTLTSALKLIEKMFKTYWQENYGVEI